MRRILTPAAGGVLALTMLLGVACGSDSKTVAPAEGDTAGATSTATDAVPTNPPAQATAVNTSSAVADRDLTTAELVRLAEPSVVRIATTGGVGSGFIVREDGYIITNNHVVETSTGRTAASVNVRLSDGTELTGRVVGTDPRSDLALVKIDAQQELHALALASLDETEVGEDVVAIGYALDLRMGEGPSFSVTRGIISAKNRAISESSNILGAIQTDAAINHGNSGGPLLNMRGEVVGVNTALAPDPLASSGVASGIGFAVGSDTVAAVYEELRDAGRVSRGLLGIQNFESLRPAKARELGLPEDTRGVFLGEAQSVPADGPAGQAGMQVGDVILAIDGQPIRTEADLAVAMIHHEPGKQVAVDIFRGGREMTIDVILGTPQVS